MKKLSKRQHRALQRWIDQATVDIGLMHWIVKADRIIRREAFAGTFMRDGSDTARIALGSAYWDETPEEQRITLTHELLHIHLKRVRQVAQDGMASGRGRTARGIWTHHYDRAEELAVEQIARVIAPLLPLPTIPRR
jgi:hypothetical protein